MTVLSQFAAALAAIDGTALAAPVAGKLRMHILDALGALLAGSRTVEGRALIAFAAGLAGDPGATVARNCALARLSELDDIHLGARVTAGSIVIPGALTIAAEQGADEGEVAAAILAGYEAMIRLGQAVEGPQVQSGGIWPTYFAAGFGVAAVAARLMRLDAVQTAHALSLALISATPSVGYHNAPTTTRWLAMGNTARSGWLAARATKAGFTSDLTLLDGAFLKTTFAVTQDTAAFTAPMDVPVLAGVSLKPWCGARQTVPATQALREILSDGVRSQEIRAIEVDVLPPHHRMINHGVTPGDRASFITSLPWQMAVAVLHPDMGLDAQQCPAAPDPALAALMERITIRPDEGLLPAYPEAWHARVTVVTDRGRHERKVTHVPGDPARPFSRDQVADKFRGTATPGIGSERTEAGLRGVLDDERWLDAALGLLRTV